jgi:hypothetical protein
METKYKYVRRHPNRRHKTKAGLKKAESVPWQAQLVWDDSIDGRKVKCKNFGSEREAAVQVDKWLIEMGKDPVNILKPVTR